MEVFAPQALQAQGAQDRDLTLDPEVTLWKHDSDAWMYAPFGQETREVFFESEPDGSNPNGFFGRVMLATLETTEFDMLGPLTLQVTLPTLRQNVVQERTRTTYVKWAYGGIAALVERVELAANGVILQSFSGRVLDIESEMKVTVEHARGYDLMTGRNGQHDGLTARTFYLPLPFWFCDRREDHQGGVPYLPVCAMRRTVRLEIRVYMHPIARCINANRVLNGASLLESAVLDAPVRMTLLADVVRLNDSERLLFTGDRRERKYLIEEIQEQEEVVEAGVQEHMLTLESTGSVKRMHWVVQDAADAFPNTLMGNRHLSYDGYNQLFLEANRNSENAIMYPPPLRTAQVLFSGNAREPFAFSETGWEFSSERVDASFYTVLQPLLYQGCNAALKEHIFSYFFALRPFAFQPSGSFDMTTTVNRIRMVFAPGLRRLNVFVYTVGYNVLAINEIGEPSLQTNV